MVKHSKRKELRDPEDEGTTILRNAVNTLLCDHLKIFKNIDNYLFVDTA
jgi:hypothetical protein